MNLRKIILGTILAGTIAFSSVYANDFDDEKAKVSEKFNKYEQEFKADLDSYEKDYNEKFDNYKKETEEKFETYSKEEEAKYDSIEKEIKSLYKNVKERVAKDLPKFKAMDNDTTRTGSFSFDSIYRTTYNSNNELLFSDVFLYLPHKDHNESYDYHTRNIRVMQNDTMKVTLYHFDTNGDKELDSIVERTDKLSKGIWSPHIEETTYKKDRDLDGKWDN